MVGKRANRINLYKKQTKKPNQTKTKQKNKKQSQTKKPGICHFPLERIAVGQRE